LKPHVVSAHLVAKTRLEDEGFQDAVVCNV
jgi:hypothetical protein